MPYTLLSVPSTAPSELAPYNPKREGLLIQFQGGPSNLFVSQDVTPLLSLVGISVAPSGALVFRKIDGDPVDQAYYGILSGGTGSVLIYEAIPEEATK